MELNIWVQIGLVVTALVPFLTAGLKKLFGSTKWNAVLPLVVGIVATLAGALGAGQIAGWGDIVPVLMVGLSGGGLGSSVRDVYAKTLMAPGA